jgi:hypothetical protein
MADDGRAWNLCSRRSVFSEIFSEIDSAFINVQQSIAGSAFREDYVVGFEPDVKELEFSQFLGVPDSNCGVVDQVAHGHQHIVDK